MNIRKRLRNAEEIAPNIIPVDPRAAEAVDYWKDLIDAGMTEQDRELVDLAIVATSEQRRLTRDQQIAYYSWRRRLDETLPAVLERFSITDLQMVAEFRRRAIEQYEH